MNENEAKRLAEDIRVEYMMVSPEKAAARELKALGGSK